MVLFTNMSSKQVSVLPWAWRYDAKIDYTNSLHGSVYTASMGVGSGGAGGPWSLLDFHIR